MRIRYLLVTCFLFCGMQANTQSKPQVTVQFNLAYVNYQIAYPDSLALKSLVADTLAGILNHLYPFLNFSRNPGGHELTFIMYADDKPNILFLPVLKTGTDTHQAHDPFVFRDFASFSSLLDPPPGIQAFALELAKSLQPLKTSPAKQQILINELFGHVKLCPTAQYSPSAAGFVMPFQKGQLALEVGSELYLDASIDTSDRDCSLPVSISSPKSSLSSTKPVICSYKIGDVKSGCTELETMRIEGVYLRTYKPLPKTTRPQTVFQ